MSGELPPWARGALRIRASVLQEIESHARECYPSESCGFLLGPADDPDLVDEARREENMADKLHRLDPEKFPRTSKTYFAIDDLRASRAFDEGNENGRPVKVIYHSHCDAGAYFSQEDTDTFSRHGQLYWPVGFVVVSVVDGEVQDRKLWIHRGPGHDEFIEAPLSVD